VLSAWSMPRRYRKDKEYRFQLVEFRDSSLPGYELESRGIELIRVPELAFAAEDCKSRQSKVTENKW
jgi:hypothetical protein